LKRFYPTVRNSFRLLEVVGIEKWFGGHAGGKKAQRKGGTNEDRVERSPTDEGKNWGERKQIAAKARSVSYTPGIVQT